MAVLMTVNREQEGDLALFGKLGRLQYVNLVV